MNKIKTSKIECEGIVRVTPTEIDYHTYQANTNDVIETFIRYSLQDKAKNLGDRTQAIHAYVALTSPESRRAGIQIGGDEGRVKKTLEEGIATSFLTAKLEGKLIVYPKVNVTIWHPTLLHVDLYYEGCDRPNIDKCHGSISWINRNIFGRIVPTFTITRKSKKKEIRLYKGTTERGSSAEEYLRQLEIEENIHQFHEDELLNAIKSFKQYILKLVKTRY